MTRRLGLGLVWTRRSRPETRPPGSRTTGSIGPAATVQKFGRLAVSIPTRYQPAGRLVNSNSPSTSVMVVLRPSFRVTRRRYLQLRASRPRASAWTVQPCCRCWRGGGRRGDTEWRRDQCGVLYPDHNQRSELHLHGVGWHAAVERRHDQLLTLRRHSDLRFRIAVSLTLSSLLLPSRSVCTLMYG